MKKFLQFWLKIISYLPFTKFILKAYYLAAIKQVKKEFINNSQVIDILLTSKMDAKEFIFGQSDLNFLIIVHNDSHPKTVLNEFRDLIHISSFLKSVINTSYIPILTQAEIKTDVIKSYLIQNQSKETFTWPSIMGRNDYRFLMGKQDHFAMLFHSFRSIDHYLLRIKKPKNIRAKTKSIYTAFTHIHRFAPLYIQISKSWERKCTRIYRFPVLAFFLKKSLEKEHFKAITHHVYPQTQLKEYQFEQFDYNLIKFLKSLLQLEFIDDFILNPSLIQPHNDQFSGKIFIIILVNKKILKKNYLNQLENLKNSIRKYENDQTKFRIRFMSIALYELLNTKALFRFPLEPLNHQVNAFSVKSIQYKYIVNYDQIQLASIHFLTTQFMRFRSLKQKTDLIGSKFIKSLNLMYKYHLLWEHLKGKPFEIHRSVTEIRELFTPQFNDISLEDEVTEEDWIIIKSQLIYLLKGIRDELARKDTSLKFLKF